MENNSLTNEMYVKKNFFAKLKSVIAQIPFANDVVSMYFCALDPKTPLKAKIEFFAAIAYFISPLDAIPDFLPGGFVDDAAAIGFALQIASVYITKEHRYQAQAWLNNEL